MRWEVSHPVLKSHWRIESFPPDQVFLLNEQGSRHFFKGAAFSRLLPLLAEGRNSTDALLFAVQGEVSEAEVFHVLFSLERLGFIEEKNDSFPKALKGFCHHLGVPLEEAQTRIEKTVFEVVSIRTSKEEELKKLLQELSFSVASSGTFKVVLVDSYRALELKKPIDLPWLLAKPEGAQIWIGPLFHPKKSGCYECFLERFEQNQVEERFVEKKQGRSTPISAASAALPTFSGLAFHLIANELTKWVLKGEHPDLEGKVLCFDTASSKLTSHPFDPRPFCACAPKQKQRLFTLESQKKEDFRDGGYRTVRPEATLRRLEPLMTPITGVIGPMRESKHNASLNMAVFAAGGNHHGLSLEREIQDQRLSSVGKGKCEAQAKVSCIAEAIERQAGFFYEELPRRKAAYKDLGEEAIHPNWIALYSEAQFRERDLWNQKYRKAPFFVPPPFSEESPIDWSPVWSLSERRQKWVPTSLCYMKHFSSNWAIADSNGCAAGNTKEEALLQGFFELVERDHLAIWWYNELAMPEVDLGRFKDASIGQTIDYYRSMGREIWALDLTLDLKIPTFGVFSRNLGGGPEEIVFGFAAHFDPEIAVCRALSEMHQVLDYLDVKKTRQELKPKEMKSQLLWDFLENGTLEQFPFFRPASKKARSDFHWDYNSDIKDDILLCQKIVEEKGMELLVLDQTRSDLKLPVVRVIVPSLRPKRNRLAPGRLYDVPFALGLLPKKRTEKELNPFPLFI